MFKRPSPPTHANLLQVYNAQTIGINGTYPGTIHVALLDAEGREIPDTATDLADMGLLEMASVLSVYQDALTRSKRYRISRTIRGEPLE